MSEPTVEPRKGIIGGGDLPGPQVGDLYTDGVKTVTVTAVGDQFALAIDAAGVEESYPILSAAEGGTMSPVVPVPVVPIPTILYEYDTGTERGLWTNDLVASATGRTIRLDPAGTWTET